MTKIYISRLYAISKAVILPVCTLFYWAICFDTIPLNEPNVSAAFNHFVEGVMIFGAVLLGYVLACHTFTELKLLLHRTPIVVITNDKLQVYDFTYNCHRVFDWKDVVKIEKTSDITYMYFDVYVRNKERYQIIEATRWQRFMQKLNTPFLQGAAVRITASTLSIPKRELYIQLQNHIQEN